MQLWEIILLRRHPCAHFLVSPKGSLLQNKSTISQPRSWQWHSQDTESSHQHKDLSYCPWESHPLLTCPHPFFKSLGTTDRCSTSIILSFQEYYTNGIMQYATFFFFSDWLFPQSIILWRFIQVVLQGNSLFLIASWYGYTFVSLIIHLLKDFWVVSCLEFSQTKLL